MRQATSSYSPHNLPAADRLILYNGRFLDTFRHLPRDRSLIGERADLTYAYSYLGAGAETLADVAAKGAVGEKPLVIVGAAATARDDGVAILASLAKTAQAMGADAYIQKPIRLDDFIREIGSEVKRLLIDCGGRVGE